MNLSNTPTERLEALLDHPLVGDAYKDKVRAELVRRRRGEPVAGVGTSMEASKRRNRPAIVLPWDMLVSVNERTNPINGRQYLTKRYRTALKRAKAEVRRQWRQAAFSGPVRVAMDFFPPDRRRRDASNFVKLVEDSMTGCVYEDDSQIVDKNTRKLNIDKVEPRVEVSVEPVDDEQEAA